MAVEGQRSPRYVAILAVTAGLILIIGWLLRPRDIPQSPPPIPSETELQELSRRTQRRSIDSTTAYFADAAAEVRPSVVYVPSTGMSAVVWDASRLLTGPIRPASASAVLSVRTVSGERATDATSSRRLPLSVLDLHAGQPVRPPQRAASMPQSGEWLVAVWQTAAEPAFAPLRFRQTADIGCGIAQARELVLSASITPEMVGGGVFTMDHELLALILPCGDRAAAVAFSSVDQMLSRLTALDERLLASRGILISTVSAEEREYFHDSEGLLIREVWMDAPGEAAGFRPGDLVLSLDGRPVATVEDLRPLVSRTGTAFEVGVRRGADTHTVVVDPNATRPEGAGGTGAQLGLVAGTQPPAFRVEAVAADSRAARAGVRPGDIVLRVNHVDVRTRAQAERAIQAAGASPLLLEVGRDQRRLAIVIPGPEGQ